jgi:hypothetical protein
MASHLLADPLVRMVRTWKQALVLVQPETLLRLPPRALPCVLEAQIKSTLEKASTFFRDDRLDQGDSSE